MPRSKSPVAQAQENATFSLTQLPDKDELVFRTWLSQLPWFNQMAQAVAKESGGPVDDALREWLLGRVVDDPQYDYRGAWLDKIEPSLNPTDQRYHWPSLTSSGRWLKAPDHPTAWKELYMQKYGVDPDTIPMPHWP